MYTREYKVYLDKEYRLESMQIRVCAVEGEHDKCSQAVPRLEATLSSSVAGAGSTLRKLSALVEALARRMGDIRNAPPVSWKRMRSLEMQTYRRQLGSFDKWDRRCTAVAVEARCLRKSITRIISNANRKRHYCQRPVRSLA